MRIKRLAQGRYCRAGDRTGTSGMEVRGLNRSATTAPQLYSQEFFMKSYKQIDEIMTTDNQN